MLDVTPYLVGIGFLCPPIWTTGSLNLVTAQQVRSIYTTHQVCRLENLDVNFEMASEILLDE